MRHSYGPRVDADGTQHARVAQATEYSIELPLYHRRIGNGTVYCRLVKAPRPARRIVELIAEYSDAGVAVQHVIRCASQDEEIRQLERLERLIAQASRRPCT